MKENNKNEEVKILKGNEFYVNYFLHKMYGPSYGITKDFYPENNFEVTSYPIYPGIEIRNKKPLYTKEESRKTISFLPDVNPEIKKELTHLAKNRELTKYRTIPKIEKKVRELNPWGREYQ